MPHSSTKPPPRKRTLVSVRGLQKQKLIRTRGSEVSMPLEEMKGKEPLVL